MTYVYIFEIITTVETWIHLSFSTFMHESESEVTQSCPTLCDPRTIVYQAPLSMGFSRQEYWSGLPFPYPRDLPNPGMEPWSPALQTDALLSEPPGKPHLCIPLSNSPTLVHPVSCTTITRKPVICFLSL